jgi:two-component system, LuxR family, sensor kinase FixL
MARSQTDSGTAAPRATVAGTRLNALLDAAVDPMVLIDSRGHITRFNASAQRVFGYAEAEVLGRNVSMLMPEPYRSEHDGYLDRYERTHEPRIIGIGREVVAQRKDGSTFPIELSVGEFQADGEHGFVGILRDITQRKQSTHEVEELRARLTHVGRIGTLGEMVSGIAHEVNQPLTAIANYANACRRMLASGQAQPQDLGGTLEKISQQAQRAGDVIRGLRNLLRKRDQVRERLDCNQLVREVVRITEFELRQSGFRLVETLAPGLPPVIGDGVQIQQVILNLIRNAFDAMSQRVSGDAVQVSTQAAADWVEIQVADSGPGIPQKVADRLFEPFFTTKPQGIGLGLSICKSIIGAHGGTLQFSSNAWGGATFQVRLPVAETPP